MIRIKKLISGDLHTNKHKQDYMQMQKNQQIYTYTYKENLAPEKSTPPSPMQKYMQIDQFKSKDQTIQGEQSKNDSGSMQLSNHTKPGLIYILKSTRISTKASKQFPRSNS